MKGRNSGPSPPAACCIQQHRDNSGTSEAAGNINVFASCPLRHYAGPSFSERHYVTSPLCPDHRPDHDRNARRRPCAGTASGQPSLFAEMRWRSIGPHRASRTVAAAGHRRQPYRFYTAAAGRRRRARPARSGRSRANRSFRLEVVSFIARTTVIAGCANIGRHVPWMMPSGSWWQFWARENC